MESPNKNQIKPKYDYGKLTGKDVMKDKRKLTKNEMFTLLISLILLVCFVAIVKIVG